jgi:hypothetical protein
MPENKLQAITFPISEGHTYSFGEDTTEAIGEEGPGPTTATTGEETSAVRFGGYVRRGGPFGAY